MRNSPASDEGRNLRPEVAEIEYEKLMPLMRGTHISRDPRSKGQLPALDQVARLLEGV